MTKEEMEKLLAESRKLNEALEAGKGNQAELKEKLEKIDAKLNEAETENQNLVKSIAAKDKEAAEMKDRMDNLEKQFKRFPAGSPDSKQVSAEMKAFEKYIHYGKSVLSPEEQKLLRIPSMADSEIKALSTDVDPDGGYLAPMEYVIEIIKKITEISPIRQYARVRRVSSPGARMFQRTTLVSSYWTGEGKTFTPSNSKYGMPEIPIHSLTTEVEITTKDLFGSAFNMESEIDMDVAEDQERAESESFVLGNGKSNPSGLITHPDIELVASGVANGIVSDNFDTLYGKLKTGYKPVYGMNRPTIAVVRKMKGGDGHYLFEMGNLAAKIPNTIKGDPYIEVPHMPDVGTNALPIFYGDLRKAYQIIDGLTMTMLRNPYRKSGYVIFTSERFVGGQIVLPEAIKLLKCATSV